MQRAKSYRCTLANNLPLSDRNALSVRDQCCHSMLTILPYNDNENPYISLQQSEKNTESFLAITSGFET